MEFCISSTQLRKALADIERAEANGFAHCEAIFFVASEGSLIEQRQMEYSDLMEKAHPTDARLNWGRGQHVTRDNKFADGSIVPLT